MPQNFHSVLGATQMGGADAGLFTFSEAGDPHSTANGILIKSLIGYCAGTAPTWTVSLEDPDDQSKSVVLSSGSGNSIDIFPAGKFIPVYNGGADGYWRLKVVTASKDDDGWVECTWRAV